MIRTSNTISAYQHFQNYSDNAPATLAVDCANEPVTYGQLRNRIDSLARVLASMGIKPDDRVAICANRSVSMITAAFATLKAGGAYVPLDPSYPVERLISILDDAAPSLLLTDDVSHPIIQCTPNNVPIIEINAVWPEGLSDIQADLQTPEVLEPSTLAYLMYTSGSTGKPKGVMIEHSGLSHQIRVLRETYRLCEIDRVLQFASFSFDMSVEEIFGTLCSGATLVLRTDEWLTSPAAFWDLCARHSITVLNLPTPFWEVLISDEDSEIPACVRLIAVGGQAMRPGSFNKWRERRTHKPRLFNAYGPTEITVNASITEITNLTASHSSLGPAIAETRFYILDDEMNQVPLGGSGEIYISGPGVARGYWRQPELTRQLFPPDLIDPSRRMFKSGDYGHLSFTGEIEFIGRSDDQLKIRGHRINLGEVEDRLRAFPEFTDAAVVPQEDVTGLLQLVGYFIPLRPNAALSDTEIRSFLNVSLPSYMIPTVYIALAHFPLLPNGKLDKKRLPKANAVISSRSVPPSSIEEEMVCALFATVLQQPTVMLDDDFFANGGSSLLLMTLFQRVRTTFGRTISWKEFPQGITPRSVAAVLSETVPLSDELEDLPWEHSAALSAPLGSAQRRIWFIQQLDPSSSAYNYAAKISLFGNLHVSCLRSALERLVTRHSIFRTTFHSRDGEPFQRIDGYGIVDLGLIDLSNIAVDAARSRLDQLASEEASAPFDVTTLPLIRWKLVRLSSSENVLIHTEHHLVHDGWSFNIALADIITHYNVYLNPDRHVLPPNVELQFSDYARWERDWAQSAQAKLQEEYWLTTLRGLPPRTQLPHNRARNTLHSFHGSSIRISIPGRLCQQLRELTTKSGITLFMIMISAFAVLVGRHSNQTDIAVGTGVANRRHRSSHKIIGMFVNTVILRFQLAYGDTWDSVLRQAQGVVTGAWENQEFPFDKIVELLNPVRAVGVNPLFQTIFSFDDAEYTEAAFEDLQMEVFDPLGSGGAKVDLNVTVIPSSRSRRTLYPTLDESAITTIWAYNRDLFDKKDVEIFVARYIRLLEAIVSDRFTYAWKSLMLSGQEREAITVLGNSNRSWEAEPRCVQEIFELEVQRSPEATAIITASERLNYRELNIRANRLARYLTGLGVGPNTRVILCMEPCVDFVVTVLAVMKSGAAYIPLEPNQPQHRIGLMIKDSSPIAILTRREYQASIAELHSNVIFMEDGPVLWGGELEANSTEQFRLNTLDSPAYIIYTSGSQGLPKGVVVSHRSLTSYASWAGITYYRRGGEGSPLLHSVGFDGIVTTLFGPLVSGKPVVIVPDRSDVVSLIHSLLKLELAFSLVKMTPAHFSVLISCIQGLGIELKTDVLMLGGEALIPSDVRWFQQAFPNVRIVNHFGPTETTVGCSVFEIEEPLTDCSIIPIGRPIGSTRIYILDPVGELVPIGVDGELYVGGAQVAAGYLNRPDLTAQHFLEDPFTPERGARMYKTGDLGRWLPDGNIQFLGRSDFQVKVRGFRIELGEIEIALMDHPDVMQAVVVVREDAPGDKRLVAYYTSANEHAKVNWQNLRSHLITTLADYMLPAAYVEVECLPLTSNGKLDRKALPSPDADSFPLRTYEPPQGEIEQGLASIWAEVLKIEQVGRNDNFFELGGHSLLAVKCVNRMRVRFQIEIGIGWFFRRGSSIRELARAISTMDV